MNQWENTLELFLESFSHKELIHGVLVCGSILTGHATPHSDLDVHLILDDDVDFRERGNRMLSGLMIEYFANPAKQIRVYFKADWQAKARDSSTQFITGKVLRDDTGVVKQLKVEAEHWHNKAFEVVPQTAVELLKYGLWDALDSLEESFEKEAPDFYMAFWYFANELIDEYRKFLGYDLLRSHRLHKLLTDPNERQRYVLPDFPDKLFAELIIELIRIPVDDSDALLQQYRRMHQHVINQLGGFDIDGWTLKSSLSIH